MNKTEFLEILGGKLSEELPRALVISNLQYYESYINGAVRGGKKEQTVMDELGDPGLIARSIIDAQVGADYNGAQYAEDAVYTETVSETAEDGTYGSQRAEQANNYESQSSTADSGQNNSGQNTSGTSYSSQSNESWETNQGQQSYRQQTFTHTDTEPIRDDQERNVHSSPAGGHGCLITSIVLILIVVAVVAIIGSVISFLWPVLVPVLLVLLIVSLFSDKRRR